MTRFRPLLIIVGIVLILGLVVWLVGMLSQLYANIAATSVVLANSLLAVLLLLLVALIAALIYYFVLFSRPAKPKRAQQPPAIPSQKIDVAEENLAALRQQLEQIQNEISRQALLERSHAIEQNLNRDHVHVVVFGTGSAGKTSIVNAIVGRMVGQIGAPMGTTTIGNTYRFRVNNIHRDIWVTDTPGILEANVMGTEREQTARRLATEADFLIFVTDNDLRQSEYDILKQLVEIGKRSILVFNKIDLYPDDEMMAILTRLRQRVQPFLSPEDVVAIAANPQPVVNAAGDRLQPSPYLSPLLRRMTAILRAEGEDLIADNILLQSQRLGEEARQIIDEQRRQVAEGIVERFQWISGGVVSVMPLPVVDLLATAAINTQMVMEIGKVYGCEINVDRAKELAVSLAKTLVGLGIVKGAVELSTFALQFNIGTLIVGQAIQGVTAAYLTRIAGKSFIEYFRHDQDWGDGGITEVVQQQFQLNRRDEFVKRFMNTAIEQIVNPLKERM